MPQPVKMYTFDVTMGYGEGFVREPAITEEYRWLVLARSKAVAENKVNEIAVMVGVAGNNLHKTAAARVMSCTVVGQGTQSFTAAEQSRAFRAYKEERAA